MTDPDRPALEKATRDQLIALLPRLRRFCLALTRSVEAGDDLTQSTIERALSRIDQWDTTSRLDSWMYRIAQNINIDAARSLARRGQHMDMEALQSVAGEDGRQIVESRSALARVQTAMAGLPADQRALMALVVLDGKSYREAADILDIPMGTVMSRMSRARQAMAASLNGATGAGEL